MPIKHVSKNSRNQFAEFSCYTVCNHASTGGIKHVAHTHREPNTIIHTMFTLSMVFPLVKFNTCNDKRIGLVQTDY